MNGLITQRRTIVAIASAWSAAVGTASGQEGSELNVDVADCIRLEAPEARLACFESRVSEALGSDAAPQEEAAQPAPHEETPAPARREVTPPETATPEPVRERASAAAERRSARAERAEAQEIVSRVRTLRETVPNAYLITLENGQVWRQTQPKWYPLRPGLEVRIFGTRWGGASRLTAEEIKSYIQVERVQ